MSPPGTNGLDPPYITKQLQIRTETDRKKEIIINKPYWNMKHDNL